MFLKSTLSTFLLLCIFNTLSAQENFKSDILTQLESLEGKIKVYKETLNKTEALNPDELYMMNSDFQENLNSISEKIYEIELSNVTEEIEEMVEIEEIEEMEEMPSIDDESLNEYKGDMNLKKDLKSKVMNSIDDFAFVLGWGINTMTHEEGNEIAHKLWGSSNWEVGFVNKRQIGSSKARFVYGLSLSTHYFKLDDIDINATKVAPGYVVTEDNDLDKVRFGVRYLQVPVGVGFKLGKKSELFVGGHVGFKVKGYTNKEYETVENEEVDLYAKADYGLNKFNYGVDVSIGAKSMRIFGKYDINPLFKDGPAHNIYTFGLRYGY